LGCCVGLLLRVLEMALIRRTVKAEDKSSSLAMTQEEILAQVGIFWSFVFTNLLMTFFSD